MFEDYSNTFDEKNGALTPERSLNISKQQVFIQSILAKHQIESFKDLETFKNTSQVIIATEGLTNYEKDIFRNFLEQNRIYSTNPMSIAQSQPISIETTVESQEDTNSSLDSLSDVPNTQSDSDLIESLYLSVIHEGLDKVIRKADFVKKMKNPVKGQHILDNMTFPDGKKTGNGKFSLIHNAEIRGEEYYVPIGPIKSCLCISFKEGLLIVDGKKPLASSQGEFSPSKPSPNAPTIAKKFLHTNTFTKTKKYQLGVRLSVNQEEDVYYVPFEMTLKIIHDELQYHNQKVPSSQKRRLSSINASGEELSSKIVKIQKIENVVNVYQPSTLTTYNENPDESDEFVRMFEIFTQYFDI